jgi:hypothetical protein
MDLMDEVVLGATAMRSTAINSLPSLKLVKVPANSRRIKPKANIWMTTEVNVTPIHSAGGSV